MQSKTFQVKLPNNKDFVVTRINAEDISKPIEIQSIHHILLLDRSGSMSNEISQLIDNVKESIKAIGDDDYISVIWFSGVGQFRTLIKGAKKYDYLPNLLDSIKSTIGATCFSESLSEVKTVIDEMEYLTPYYCVTLFTDGNAVTPWSSEEEMTKSRKLVEEISLKSLAFNTIGYGNYYNRDFLISLSNLSQFGVYTHSLKIDNYYDIFLNNFESVSNMVNVITEVEGDEIVYISPKSVVYSKGYLKQRQRSKIKNIYYVVGEDVKVNMDVVSKDYNISSDIEGYEERIEFLYAYAYSLYYNDKRKDSLDVLLALGDKALIDSHMSSFTYDEVAVHLAKLKDAIFKLYTRNPGIVDANYLPSDDSFCLLDLFNIFQKEDCYYIPFSKYAKEYRRITRKKEESMSLFEASEDEVKAKFDKLVFSSEQLNLSLKFEIPGRVKLNPLSAKSVGLPEFIDSKIFRTHTFIKDGFLNIDQIEVVIEDEISSNVISQLQSNGIKFEYLPVSNVEESRLLINLNQLPLVSYKYVKDLTADNIHQLIERELSLEAKQKYINFVIDQFEETRKSSAKVDDFKKYTVDQIRVLSEHGISNKMVYQGIGNKVDKIEDCDFYTTRSVSFYIKGVSALPSINEFVKRKESGKELLASHKPIQEAIDELTSKYQNNPNDNTMKGKRFLEDELKKVRKELLEIRTKINAVKLAKLLTGDWFENFEPDDKGNFIHESKSSTLVAKVSYVKIYIN